MFAHWSPSSVARASLVPAGFISCESPACGVGNHDHCATLGARHCSCSCHRSIGKATLPPNAEPQREESDARHL
jgi:hypothetical protein